MSKLFGKKEEQPQNSGMEIPPPPNLDQPPQEPQQDQFFQNPVQEQQPAESTQAQPSFDFNQQFNQSAQPEAPYQQQAVQETSQPEPPQEAQSTEPQKEVQMESQIDPIDRQKMGAQEVKKKREEIKLSDEPLFTKIEDYKAILEASDHMKGSLKDCDEILKRLNEIKVEEDKEYEKWKKMLLDVYRKIHYIDRTFFEEKQ
ncbi:MAG: hypothetical protein ACQESG_00390 [Nanobdellota archaeon]